MALRIRKAFFVIVSSMMLIVVHNQSRGLDSNNLQKSKRAGSARVLSAPIPLSRLEFVRGTEIDQCPTSSLPQRDMVKSESPAEVQPGKVSYTLV